ncbi:MAG TPA: hypothetical protein VFA68_19460 [Terriglobales bacterium]|nr:hypothetical protein [Terriglobales bacterium]
MNLTEWSRSSIDYGRKLVNSGLEGAREGEEEFLHGDSLTPFLGDSLRDAWKPAVVGACLGTLGGCLTNGRRPSWRTLGFGVLGGLIGLSAGIVWSSRGLGRCVFYDAVKKINRVRDEHWLEKNPIDYA